MSALTRITLLGLTILGAVTLHGISTKSGYFDLIRSHVARKILAGGTLYTGQITHLAPLDRFLSTLVQFFWPTVDGSNPSLTLMTAMFGGQFGAALSVILLEGMRNGNRGKLISYISIYGFLIQAGGIAVIAPAYLLLYTFTSPTHKTPSINNLSIHPSLLSSLPFALTLGFVIPTLTLAFPLSTTAKINAIAFWQGTPIYTVLLAHLWKGLSSATPAQASPRAQIQKLRTIYKYTLSLASVAHIGATTLSLTALFLPNLYTPTIAAAFHPLAAIIPQNPLTAAATPVASMSAGALNFLQWDFLGSSAAYLVFALGARFNRNVDAKGLTATELLGMVGRVAVVGPMGAMVGYLWERDEIVFARGQELKKLK